MNQALLMQYEAALESLKEADIIPADVFYDVLEELTRQEEPTPEMLEAGYNVTVGDWSDAKGLLRAQYLAMRAAASRPPQLVGQEAAKAMLKCDGFYICGDTRTPGVFVPIAIINGKAYPWEMESTPLDPDRWQPTLLVSGPYDAPRAT